MNFSNQVVIVTGGANGMGKAIALALLKEGARVGVFDSRPDSLQEMKNMPECIRYPLSLHCVDIRKQDEIKRGLQEVIQTHGTVDGIINNAGLIQPFVRIQDLSDSDIQRVMDVNFLGTLSLIRAALPTLITRPRAFIANVSSMGGFLPVPGQAIYGASKAAVKLMTEALYAELLGTQVSVSLILPGAMSTQIAQNSGVRIPSLSQPKSIPSTSPEKAAKIVLDGIKNRQFYIFIGNDSKMMNFMMRD
jgi:short-subunit dehydrogenase